jgi:hypothetical protein
MHIIGDRTEKVGGGVDNHRPVATPEKVTSLADAMVIPGRVGTQKPLHSADEVRLGCFQQEMKMIRKKTEGVNLPAGFCTGFAQGVQEKLIVGICVEDALVSIASAHDLVKRPREFNS